MSQYPKLKQLQAIRDQLMNDNDWPAHIAVVWIANELKRETNTVYTWLTESQRQPIPDDTLALLKLLTQS